MKEIRAGQFRKVVVGSLLSLGLVASAWAAYPDKPVKIMVGFAAGGGADTLARLVAKEAEKSLGQPLVVENAPGGGGVVAATKLMNAPADGYTIGMAVTSTFSFAPLASKSVKYGVDDFDYLASAAAIHGSVIAKADAPFNTAQEMLAYGKSHGPLSFASSSPAVKLSMDYASLQTGVDFNVVPVKGGAKVIKDLLGGHMMLGFSAGIHQKYGDQFKVIVAAGANRLKSAPQAPTWRELGVDMGSDTYFMFFAPKNLPKDVASKLITALSAAAKTQAVRDLAEGKMGFPIEVVTGDNLRAHVKSDVTNFAKLLKAVAAAKK